MQRSRQGAWLVVTLCSCNVSHDIGTQFGDAAAALDAIAQPSDALFERSVDAAHYTLDVFLKTDFAPVTDFQTVRIEVAAQSEPDRILAASELTATATTNYTLETGALVAQFDVIEDTYLITITLYDAGGSVVAHQRSPIYLRINTMIRIVLAREST